MRMVQWTVVLGGVVSATLLMCGGLCAEETVISGTILQPDGTPASQATVVLANLDYSPMIWNGAVERENSSYVITTNDEGYFEFPAIDFAPMRKQFTGSLRNDLHTPDYIIMGLHDSGFKRVTQKAWEDNSEQTLMLDAWGRIEGTIRQGTAPEPGARLFCLLTASKDELIRPRDANAVWFKGSAVSDANGNFVFEKLPPGEIHIVKYTASARMYGESGIVYDHCAGLIVAPGETAHIAIGGKGRPVTGKLASSASFASAPSWSPPWTWKDCQIRLIPSDEPQTLVKSETARLQISLLASLPHEIVEEADSEKRKEWLGVWLAETDEGRQYQAAETALAKRREEFPESRIGMKQMPKTCVAEEDGSFIVYDLEPGQWTLEAILHSPTPNSNVRVATQKIGGLTRKFTIDEFPGTVTDEPLDLGELIVEPIIPRKSMIRTGATAPDFEILRLEPVSDGNASKPVKTLQLSDYRGKYVVLNFWATWCGPCWEKLPELKAFHKKIADDEGIVLIGISLEEPDYAEMLGGLIVKREMHWTHGLAGGWEANVVRDYGVSAVPALIVIDPEGQVVLANPSVAEIEEFYHAERRMRKCRMIL